MDKKERIAGILLLTSIIIGLMLLIDFLALHDISNDYVSNDIIDSFGGSFKEDLPEWAATRLEWIVVGISHGIKAVLTVFNIILIIKLGKKD